MVLWTPSYGSLGSVVWFSGLRCMVLWTFGMVFWTRNLDTNLFAAVLAVVTLYYTRTLFLHEKQF